MYYRALLLHKTNSKVYLVMTYVYMHGLSLLIGTVIATCFSKPHCDDSHFNSSLLRFSKVMVEDYYYVCVSNISWTTSYIV